MVRCFFFFKVSLARSVVMSEIENKVYYLT